MNSSLINLRVGFDSAFTHVKSLGFITWEIFPSCVPLCHTLFWKLLCMHLFHHIWIHYSLVSQFPWNTCITLSGFWLCTCTMFPTVTLLLIQLHWPLINFRVLFKILIMTFRALHRQIPVYISKPLHPYISSKSLRGLYGGQGLLTVHHTSLKTKEKSARVTLAPRLWNSLPLSLRTLDSA